MIEKHDRFLKNHHRNDDVFILSNLGKRVHDREGVGWCQVDLVIMDTVKKIFSLLN